MPANPNRSKRSCYERPQRCRATGGAIGGAFGGPVRMPLFIGSKSKADRLRQPQVLEQGFVSVAVSLAQKLYHGLGALLLTR